jgi:hypothetical protein
VGLLAAIGSSQTAPGSSPQSACSLVQQALKDSQAIKPGVTRKDVEKRFDYDGGLEFSDHAMFTYRGCRYIKLEIEFEPGPGREGKFKSPDDIVTKASKLFIDYPRYD